MSTSATIGAARQERSPSAALPFLRLTNNGSLRFGGSHHHRRAPPHRGGGGGGSGSVNSSSHHILNGTGGNGADSELHSHHGTFGGGGHRHGAGEAALPLRGRVTGRRAHCGADEPRAPRKVHSIVSHQDLVSSPLIKWPNCGHLASGVVGRGCALAVMHADVDAESVTSSDANDQVAITRSGNLVAQVMRTHLLPCKTGS